MFKKISISFYLAIFLGLFFISVNDNRILAGERQKTADSSILRNTTVQSIDITTNAGIDLEKNVQDSSNQISTHNAISPSSKFKTLNIKYPDFKNGIINTSIQKYSYEFMMQDIKKLNKKYNKLVSIEYIGKSSLGRDIPVVILGNNQNKTKLLVVGSIHGREYITTVLIMKQIEEYLKSYFITFNNLDIKKILSVTSIYFIPMLNPDGVQLSQYGLNSIQNTDLKTKLCQMNNKNTNFTRWKANSRGVDLNRNFNSGWSSIELTKPSPEKYKGRAPESEAESIAIAKYIKLYKFDALISYHSTGSILYWYDKQSGGDYKRDLVIAKALSSITKYTLVKPSKDCLEGGLKDWYIPTFKKPGFTIEIGAATECPIPISEFPHIWNENKIVPLALCKLINKYSVK